MSKKLLLTLILSLGFNVFLVGVFIGSRFNHGPHNGPQGSDGPPPPPEMMMTHIIKDRQTSISPEGQKIIADILEKNHADRPDMAFGQTMDDMKAVLTADKLDVTRMEVLQKTIDTLEENHHKNIGPLIQNIARSLPDQDRIAFFKELFSGKGPRPDGPPMDGPPHPDFEKRELDKKTPTE